jgi:hypothetical protein
VPKPETGQDDSAKTAKPKVPMPVVVAGTYTALFGLVLLGLWLFALFALSVSDYQPFLPLFLALIVSVVLIIEGLELVKGKRAAFHAILTFAVVAILLCLVGYLLSDPLVVTEWLLVIIAAVAPSLVISIMYLKRLR